MRTVANRYLIKPWMRYPVAFQDEAARQCIEMSRDDRPYVPEPFPPCHVCGTKEIYCWPVDKPEATICAACCDKSEDGHDFKYERFDGHICQRCGDKPSDEWYADRAAD